MGGNKQLKDVERERDEQQTYQIQS